MAHLAVTLFAAAALCAAEPGIRFQAGGELGLSAQKALHAVEARLRELPSTPNLTVEVRQTSAKPESFRIERASPSLVRISGGGPTGAAYGLYEVLGQLETKGSIAPVSREPALRKRGMTVFLYNQQLEDEWLYDREYWDRYFALLARSRFNYFTLVFGHQTSYLAPPFPFFIEVPGYEKVRPAKTDAAQRRRNLEMLRMISEAADAWGVQFIFGIWQQHAHLYGKNLVEGLEYRDLFDYCPKALALILKACPRIRGVQFRMNIESGIEEDDQNRFYTGMAKAIRESGLPVSLDFRAKGLRAETIDSALQLGIKPIVSTKYWREHMGLPFHGTRIDASDKERSYRRYGYWDLLPHDRPYDVAYRMWSLGSIKLLLWGSLDYARQFAKSAQFGDSLGFEVCAPLSQKGFGNWPGGNWRILAKDREYYRWEFERYWAYYLAFGLAGYAPQGDQPVYEAEFRKHFGEGGAAVREAYEAASWVIPFVTAVRAVSNSNFGYWPEMETGGFSDRYFTQSTGDDNRFYRIDEYVQDRLAGRASAKMTPAAMAEALDGWAARASESMQRATAKAPPGEELRSTQTDMEVLARLARYHAARMRSATAYGFFLRSADRHSLRTAIAQFDLALSHWREIAKHTTGVYFDHMVFNRPPDQIGHWKDELPLLEAESKRLHAIDGLYDRAVAAPEKTLQWKAQMPRYKLAMRYRDDNGTLKRWADVTPTAEEPGASSDRYSARAPETVWREVIERVRYRRILHSLQEPAQGDEPLTIHASLTGARDTVRFKLFYRVAGKGFAYTAVPMRTAGDNLYSAQVDGLKAGSQLLYYLRADAETAYFQGSDKEPLSIPIRGKADSGPSLRRIRPGRAQPGTPVPVRVAVTSGRELQALRLHYRHVDQSEDWRIVEMLPTAGGLYQATIPGEFVHPGWDLMYAIEAIDDLGAGVFSPDWRREDPAEVIPVAHIKGGPASNGTARNPQR